jgi:hypothetical protein
VEAKDIDEVDKDANKAKVSFYFTITLGANVV